MTLRYTKRSESGWHNNSNGFQISQDQLIGLTRDQIMSSGGTQVQFQLKRDAGSFNCEGWFKAQWPATSFRPIHRLR